MIDPTHKLDEAVYALRADPAESLDAFSKKFDALFPWYSTFLRPWLPADRESPMLDVPCGAGNLLYTLRKLGYTAISGVDSDSGQVAIAQRLGLPAQVGDAFAAVTACAPGTLQRIFSLDFLEHLEPANAIEFLRHAFRALSSPGALICRMPSADGPFGSHDRYNDLTHRWAVTSNAIIPVMQLGGFRAGDVVIRQEAPVAYNLTNLVRRGLFQVTTRSLGAFLDLVGVGAPRVWTRSMWIIAQK
jgi:SAM-dependent methyltransferase